MAETTPDFWDCNCKENYIHPYWESECGKCGAEYNEETWQDYPNSLISDVLKDKNLFKRIMYWNCPKCGNGNHPLFPDCSVCGTLRFQPLTE